VHTVLVVSFTPMISTSSPILMMAALDPARHHGAAPGDAEHVLDGHQERLVNVALGWGTNRPPPFIRS
jgi:hypothetical protein